MAFPSLFPYGYGDPFLNHAKCANKTFILKVRYLLDYCENYKGNKEFRFAEHPRFVFAMYSLFYKERINNQANFYLKQNPQEANMTIAQMKALIGTGNKNHVVKNIQRYMSNIPGTPSYWYALNLDLETIIKDKGRFMHFLYFHIQIYTMLICMKYWD